MLQNPAQQGFSSFGSRIAPLLGAFIRAHPPGDSGWIVFQTEAVGFTTRLGIPRVIGVDDLGRRIHRTAGQRTGRTEME